MFTQTINDILAVFHPYGWVLIGLAVITLAYIMLYIAFAIYEQIKWNHFMKANTGVDEGDE